MQRLSITECQSFFEHYLNGLLTTRLIAPLETFVSSNKILMSALFSWQKALKDGVSYRNSLINMSPRFPACIEQLLILASDRSVLDKGVQDILYTCSQNDIELNRHEAITRLIGLYESAPVNGIICTDCFDKTFVKLLARYDLEEANELILSQDGDDYFHQKYVGVKLVHIIEPAHKMVFASIRKKLQDAAKSGALYLAESDRTYIVNKINAKRFLLKSANNHSYWIVIKLTGLQ